VRARFVNEKFKEESDPVKDMGIGGIDLKQVYKNTALKGVKDWEKFLNQFIGKRVRFKPLQINKKNDN